MEYLVAILLGIIGSLIAAELYANAPRIADSLLEGAIARLPRHKQERYREEWHAHLNECVGNVGKLWHAANCYLFAARGIQRAFAVPAKRRNNRTISSARTLLKRQSKLLWFAKFASIRLPPLPTVLSRGLTRITEILADACRYLMEGFLIPDERFGPKVVASVISALSITALYLLWKWFSH